MIFRREKATSSSKRFRSTILNPVGIKIKNKQFIKIHQKTVGTNKGAKVCYRRKKSIYITKFNFTSGLTQKNYGTVLNISLARRSKTSIGLVKYSNGSLSCVTLCSGAFIGMVLKVWTLFKNSRVANLSEITAGSTVPLTYLQITDCFFNVKLEKFKFGWFCKAGGTFNILSRINLNKGSFIVKLPSNKLIALYGSTHVMLGRNSNVLIRDVWLTKAGNNIKKGFKANVRGVAMNPVDHPHGGRTKTNSPERTPWGKIAKNNK
jgi:large subunit ribosomal protein L2